MVEDLDRSHLPDRMFLLDGGCRLRPGCWLRALFDAVSTDVSTLVSGLYPLFVWVYLDLWPFGPQLALFRDLQRDRRSAGGPSWRRDEEASAAG